MHKWSLSVPVSVAARMVFVTSFLVIMPCWAVFRVREELSAGDRQDVAKVVTTPHTAADITFSPPDRLAAAEDADPHPAAVPDPVLRSTTAVTADLTIVSIRQLEDRLKELGAEYMLLGYHVNPNGDQGKYRFLCRMPIPNSMAYERPFEAAADDPVSAMQQVLREVELWRSANRRNDPPAVAGRPAGEAAAGVSR